MLNPNQVYSLIYRYETIILVLLFIYIPHGKENTEMDNLSFTHPMPLALPATSSTSSPPPSVIASMWVRLKIVCPLE